MARKSVSKVTPVHATGWLFKPYFLPHSRPSLETSKTSQNPHKGMDTNPAREGHSHTQCLKRASHVFFRVCVLISKIQIGTRQKVITLFYGIKGCFDRGAWQHEHLHPRLLSVIRRTARAKLINKNYLMINSQWSHIFFLQIMINSWYSVQVTWDSLLSAWKMTIWGYVPKFWHPHKMRKRRKRSRRLQQGKNHR